jgi:glucose-1-phosphate thymidylyltransferase
MDKSQPDQKAQTVIGLIPAAGQATRLGSPSFSKELYPIGFERKEAASPRRTKVVCEYLLEKMRRAGIKNVYLVLRQGKWDIPAYLRDGSTLGIHIAYLMMNFPFGAPYTLDQAYPFVRQSVVALGFPDILFSPDDAFEQLVTKQKASEADVVLGLFPADRPDKVDMVDVEPDGKVRQIVIKPQQTSLRWSWGIAVWTPSFTHYMHEYLASAKESAAERQEPFVGDIVQAAIQEGLRVEAVQVSNEPFLDIGTADDLARAAQYLRSV